MLATSVVEALERVAMERGTAVRCLRAAQRLRRAHEELESRVEERTAALALAGDGLHKEVEQRARARQAFLKSAQELKLFACSLRVIGLL